jgi:hypothetical protein
MLSAGHARDEHREGREGLVPGTEMKGAITLCLSRRIGRGSLGDGLQGMSHCVFLNQQLGLGNLQGLGGSS